MRLNTTILLCVLCHMSMYAQYGVYTITGNVTIKHTDTWQKAKKGMEVFPWDSISIGKGAKVQILNQGTSQIYESIETGNYTVAKLISNAKKQSGRVIAELNKEMYQNVRADNGRANSFVGASTRGDEELYTDSIYAFLLSNIGQAEAMPDNIIVKSIRKGKAFYLSIKNDSDKGRYINLLIHNKRTGECASVYTADLSVPGRSCLFVAAGETAVLRQMMFNISKDFEYVVWATERPYDSNHLQNLMATSPSVNITDLRNITIIAKKIMP